MKKRSHQVQVKTDVLTVLCTSSVVVIVLYTFSAVLTVFCTSSVVVIVLYTFSAVVTGFLGFVHVEWRMDLSNCQLICICSFLFVKILNYGVLH